MENNNEATPKFTSFDFNGALEAAAECWAEKVGKANDPSMPPWEELDPMTKYAVKEHVLPIVNAVLLFIGEDD